MDFILNQNNLYIVLIVIASGAMLLWPLINKAGSSKSVGIQQAVQLANQKQGVFLDVRSPEQFKTGSIPQARNLPAADLDAKLATLPKNKPIIAICDQGKESARVVASLRKQGFEDAVSLEGGLRAWTAANMPLTKNT